MYINIYSFYSFILIFVFTTLFHLLTFFLFKGSNAQIVYGVFIAVVFIKLYSYYRPFKELGDDSLQELALYQVFITLFISLLLRTSELCYLHRWSYKYHL
jgi:hypothetical protein